MKSVSCTSYPHQPTSTQRLCLLASHLVIAISLPPTSCSQGYTCPQPPSLTSVPEIKWHWLICILKAEQSSILVPVAWSCLTESEKKRTVATWKCSLQPRGVWPRGVWWKASLCSIPHEWRHSGMDIAQKKCVKIHRTTKVDLLCLHCG